MCIHNPDTYSAALSAAHSQLGYVPPTNSVPPTGFAVRYEASRSERVIIKGPCGELHSLSIEEAQELCRLLTAALKRRHF